MDSNQNVLMSAWRGRLQNAPESDIDVSSGPPELLDILDQLVAFLQIGDNNVDIARRVFLDNRDSLLIEHFLKRMKVLQAEANKVGNNQTLRSIWIMMAHLYDKLHMMVDCSLGNGQEAKLVEQQLKSTGILDKIFTATQYSSKDAWDVKVILCYNWEIYD